VIYFHDSASGHLAMERLFFECNVRLISYYLDPDIKITYENIYNQYKLYQNLEVYINLEIKKHKFLDFIQGDIIIYVTRDPISRLKTHINHIYPKDEFLVNITLEDDPSKILNCTCFLNNSSNISVEFLDVFLKEKKDTVFMINNHYVDFLNSHNIFFMDMKDIDCDNAFDTMCMLSKKFHFKAPSLSSLTVFKTRMTGVFDFILPKILCINLDDVNVRIIITTLNRTVGDFLDVTKEFIYDTLEYKNLVLYMTREDYKILKQYNDIFKKCQEYLHDFIRKLIIKVNYEQSKKIDEIQILKYLRANNELKVLLKNILDQELIYIKNHRPDIVASWKYYQEFEKICRE
ncbi:DUF2972 domain-containing protein, partial [Campylobacter coli]|nr:DUF2972 domain-containing protein [Campylobacter coli]HEH5121213.1 DUF2972 domain-containing protein [Campylobacter coli]